MYLNEGWNIISAAAPELFIVRNKQCKTKYWFIICGASLWDMTSSQTGFLNMSDFTVLTWFPQ